MRLWFVALAMYPLLLWCMETLRSGMHYMVLHATAKENKVPVQHWVRQHCRSLMRVCA